MSGPAADCCVVRCLCIDDYVMGKSKAPGCIYKEFPGGKLISCMSCGKPRKWSLQKLREYLKTVNR